jgi:cell division control protein 7
VLLRVVHQTVAIDVWAVGVILISILTARFPFFQSEDDADALIEMATIFGLKEMKECASLHSKLSGCLPVNFSLISPLTDDLYTRSNISY